MMRRAYLLAIAAILLSPVAFAAHETYEYFDFPNCIQGSIENDPIDGNKKYDLLLKRAEASQVFHLDENRLGLCRQVPAKNQAGVYSRRYSKIVCLENAGYNFLLAGATYRLIEDRGALPSYICIKGCKSGIPRMIHDIGYESPEDWVNIEYENQLRHFRRQCEVKKK